MCAMSIVLIVTLLVCTGLEDALPPWGLLVLTAVTLPSAIAVDTLVLVGPLKRTFRDPLASHPDEARQNSRGNATPDIDDPH